MSEADRRNTTPTRRDIAAGGIAMMVLAAAAAGVDKAQEVDGHLLALCRESVELSTDLDRITDALCDMEPKREAHPLAQRKREAAERFCELRQLIADLPARTPEGLQAKARVVLAEFDGDDDYERYPGQYDPRGALALSLARDLLGKGV
jgi:hypothetical protein